MSRPALAGTSVDRISATSSTLATELLRVACDGDMCSYANEDGERVTFTFDRAAVKAGRTGGIIGIKVD